MAKIKVNFTVDEELLARIDSFADDNYTSRSAVLTMAANQYLMQHEAVQALVTMSLAMDRVSKSGEIDEETKRQFEDFDRLAKLIAGK